MLDTPIIDVDVHHRWRTEDELTEYLPKHWRDFVALPGDRKLSLTPGAGGFVLPNSNYTRLDAWAEDGAPPGSEYDMLRKQLLDPYNVQGVVLSFDIGTQPGMASAALATAVTQAANDWSIDRWLSRGDRRLYGAVLVPTQDPVAGAAEIRRVGKHPKIVEALLVVNGMGKPFGDSVYHPLYEAAAELDLPIAMHIGAEQLIGTPQSNAGGILATRFEQHSANMQPMQHHLASFITEGVFEKYPNLQLVVVESGVAWAPWLMWELDAQYKSLKRESNWVKRWPSEYFREHVRMSTQPLELSPERSQMIELFEAFGGMDEVLMFATDYPHWDFDNPTYIVTRFPDAWRRKIFFENAAKLYRWPLRSMVAAR